MTLAGKVAVITGGASGIGRGMARCFAANGMRVVLADIESGPLDEVVTELTTKVNTAANIVFHARIIAEMSIKRELIALSSEVARDAFEPTTDVFELLDRTESGLFKISDANIRTNYLLLSVPIDFFATYRNSSPKQLGVLHCLLV